MSTNVRGKWPQTTDAVEFIASDISGRRSIGNEFDGIDDDIKDEMLQKWANIIDGAIAEALEEEDERS